MWPDKQICRWHLLAGLGGMLLAAGLPAFGEEKEPLFATPESEFVTGGDATDSAETVQNENTEAASSLTPIITGSIELRGDYHPQENFLQPDDDAFFDSVFDLNISGKIGEVGQYVVKPRLRYHSGGLVRPHVELLEQDEDRPLFTLREAYMEFYYERMEFTVGKQLFTWGKGDALKPTDVINPHDNLVIPESEKIGVPSVSVLYNGDHLTAEVVFLPFFTPGRTPQFNNRWFPDPTPIIDLYQSFVGVPPRFNFTPRELPSNSIGNVQGGARLATSSLITGWDLELAYFRGFDTNGTYNVVPQAIPRLDFTQIYPEYHMVGASFSTTWRDFEFHGEAAFNNTVDGTLDDDFITYIAGLNYTFYEVIPGALKEIFIVLEYAGEQTVNPRDAILAADTGLDRGFTNSVISRIEWRFTEETALETDGVYNFDTEDYSVGARLTHEVNDYLKLEAGADFYWGPVDTFFGAWRRNDRLYGKVTVTF